MCRPVNDAPSSSATSATTAPAPAAAPAPAGTPSLRPTERTLLLIKPDGVRRGLVGEILRRVEAKGYVLEALELRQVERAVLAEHYAEHEGKPFFEPLLEFMSSGPVVAAVVEGDRVIEGLRALAGPTDPTTAPPGSIRGDLGRDWGEQVQQNIVHGSDSPTSAAREIAIWFPDL